MEFSDLFLPPSCDQNLSVRSPPLFIAGKNSSFSSPREEEEPMTAGFKFPVSLSSDATFIFPSLYEGGLFPNLVISPLSFFLQGLFLTFFPLSSICPVGTLEIHVSPLFPERGTIPFSCPGRFP